MTIPIYTPINSGLVYFFPHFLNTCYLLFFDESHSDQCEVLSHWHFDLHFLKMWCWESFCMPIGHLHIFFEKITSLQFLCPFLFVECWIIWVLCIFCTLFLIRSIICKCLQSFIRASLPSQMVKNLPVVQETQVPFLGQEDHLEIEMTNHSSILAWRIPWTEEPGRLQSMESQSQIVLSN